MNNIFTKHPHSVNESYLKHLWFAFLFGAKMILFGLVCIIHALLPFLFEKTGSAFLLKATRDFIERTPVFEERMRGLAETIQRKMRR